MDRDFDRKCVGNFLEIDWLVVQHALVLVEVLDEFGDAAPIVELVRLLRFFAFVFDRDANTFIEKSFFAQAFR